MNKIIFCLLTAFFFSSGLYAQQDVRNTETIIAAALKNLPAETGTDLNNAMHEMEKLGEQGFYQLAMRMGPYGKEDDAPEQYAIMGYVSYVSAPGREKLKAEAERALLQAINDNTDPANQIFFMDMLTIIGGNASVAPMGSALGSSLSYKAADVLTAIGTPEAGQELHKALKIGGTSRLPALIQALGVMKYTPALEDLAPFVNGNDPLLKEVALKAIANIGDPSSADLLLKETSADGKPFSDLDNTSLYGNYIENLASDGNTAEAAKLAETFIKQTQKTSTLSRIAALQTLTKIKGNGALNTLSKAAFTSNPEYSGAALQLAAPLINSSNISLFTNKKSLLKASPAILPGIISFLGNHGGNSALPAITGLASKSNNQDVKNAAIIAMTQLGGPAVLPTLLSLLKTSDPEVSPTIQKALQLLPGKDLNIATLTAAMSGSPTATATLINVIASKGGSDAFAPIFNQLNSPDASIRKAALSALPDVSNPADLPQLFNMLNDVSDPEEISAVQNAIGNALSSESFPEEILLAQLAQTPVGKQTLLFPLFSQFGSGEALNKLVNIYRSGSGSMKQEALRSIISWANPAVLGELSSIIESPQVNQKDRADALKSYIRLISKADIPSEQKLLMYEKAMSEATNDDQKKLILNSVNSIPDFTTLAFAAKYLDDPAVGNTAANTVINIGMNSDEFHGTLVRSWLTKAADILTGLDDVYTKKAVRKFLDDMSLREGYESMFDGKDLSGWKGLVENPVIRAKMTRDELEKAQLKADSIMNRDWVVEDGNLVYVGHGYENITSVKKYGNFEMLVDWKIFDDGQKNGDAGIYLRGTPQVQIWDTSRVAAGAQVGSGGLYNNQQHRSTPLKVADNPLGEWNHFYIKMVGDRVTVYLNGELVTDNVPLENYWDRNMPLFPEEQIELQAHGSKIAYRNIYIRELPNDKPFVLPDEEKSEGFQILFDGKDLDSWVGNKIDYVVEDGMIAVRPQQGNHGNLYTEKEYGDFVFRFDFKLTPGANNGVGIRAPLEGDAAYLGMEIQILDNTADIYKDLHQYQYHGSIYGVIPAKRGYLNPVGNWNHEEIIAKGDNIKVVLNGETIVDGNIRKAAPGGKTMDGKDHPGLFNKEGHIGFLGHGDTVFFRNIRIKEL